MFFTSYIFFNKQSQSIEHINSEIKNAYFAKFRKSYKITLQLIKHASQFANCEARIRSLLCMFNLNPVFRGPELQSFVKRYFSSCLQTRAIARAHASTGQQMCKLIQGSEKLHMLIDFVYLIPHVQNSALFVKVNITF